MNELRDAKEPYDREEFLREAASKRTGLVAEFWGFLKHNKKWWLCPILVAIVIIGLLAILAANPATAPFIYPLF